MPPSLQGNGTVLKGGRLCTKLRGGGLLVKTTQGIQHQAPWAWRAQWENRAKEKNARRENRGERRDRCILDGRWVYLKPATPFPVVSLTIQSHRFYMSESFL